MNNIVAVIQFVIRCVLRTVGMQQRITNSNGKLDFRSYKTNVAHFPYWNKRESSKLKIGKINRIEVTCKIHGINWIGIAFPKFMIVFISANANMQNWTHWLLLWMWIRCFPWNTGEQGTNAIEVRFVSKFSNSCTMPYIFVVFWVGALFHFVH